MKALLVMVFAVSMASACQKSEEPGSSAPTPAGPAAAPAETPAH